MFVVTKGRDADLDTENFIVRNFITVVINESYCNFRCQYLLE